MSDLQHPPSSDQQISKHMQQGIRKGTRFAISVGSRFGKKMARKALQKMALAGMKALIGSLSFLVPMIAVISSVLFLGYFSWYFLEESRGMAQNYNIQDLADQNGMQVNDKGDAIGTSLTQRNQEIRSFYQYFGTQAYHVLDPKKPDRAHLVSPIGTNQVPKDYYEQEKLFSINPNFLFLVDEAAFKGVYRYPEQFLKPVHFDEKKLELKSLTDDKGRVIAESFKVDEKTKKAGTQKVKSVADYGLASVFRYKSDKLTQTIEGAYTKEDYFDDTCECVKQRTIHEPFSFTLPGYPMSIDLIDKAITMAGTFDLKYVVEKKEIAPLREDKIGTKNPRDPKVKVWVSDYAHYKTRTVTIPKILPTGQVVNETKQERYLAGTYPLYRYRKGAIYETVPIPDPVNSQEKKMKNQKYLQDYLMNLEVWLPQNVMETFNFKSRVGEQSDYVPALSGGDFLVNTTFPIGSDFASNHPNVRANEENFDRIVQDFGEAVQKYAAMYGVQDPFILLAKITQESNGRIGSSAGPLNIVGTGARTVETLNVQTGKMDRFTITGSAERNDIDKAVRWATMYLANKLKTFNGDYLKALQSYNFDISIIEKWDPVAWKTQEWLKYREKAREYHGQRELGRPTRSVQYSPCADALQKPMSLTVYGDVCYVEHVMRHYKGTNFKGSQSQTPVVDGGSPPSSSTTSPTNSGSGASPTTLPPTGGIDPKTKTYENQPLFYYGKPYFDLKTINGVLKSTKSFDEKVRISDVSLEEGISLYDVDFSIKNTGNLSDHQFLEIAGDIEWGPVVSKAPFPYSSFFGMRDGAMHRGVDIALPQGTPVFAVADGTIVKAVNDQSQSKKSWGNYVKIHHGEHRYTLYAHLFNVAPGITENMRVTKGQLIGYVGNTGNSFGNHLHFELYNGDDNLDRIDPLPLLKQGEAALLSGKVKLSTP